MKIDQSLQMTRINCITFELDCNSMNVVYLLTCKVCHVKSVGSCSTKFRTCFNNYKPCNNRHKSNIVPQLNLQNHFDLPDYSGFSDFQFTLIDQGIDLQCTRKREKFWQYKLDPFLPCLLYTSPSPRDS